MKKIIITIILVHLLITNSFANELEDCSVYKKLTPKYLACKATNLAKNTMKYQTEQWSDSNKDKKNKKD